MGNLSDDESSDSSNEYLIPANKINLNSSFFNETTEKANPNSKRKSQVSNLSDDNSEDGFDDASDNVSSAELLVQVLKNLENLKNQTVLGKSSQYEASTSKKDSKVELKDNDISKEISDLLLQGESDSTLFKEDNNDTEHSTKLNIEYVVPEKGVQIHLPGENLILDKKKKKQQDLRKILQNKINARLRTTQNYCHKVGLLFWLAHGFYLNKLANDPDLLGISLSLLSPSNYPKERPDLKYFEKFTKWFAQKFTICEEHQQILYNKDILLQRVSDKKIHNYIELVLLYIAMVRGMGINCRLVISLQPPPLKPTVDQLFKISDDNIENNSYAKSNNVEQIKTKKNDTKEKKTSQIQNKKCKSKSLSKDKLKIVSKVVSENKFKSKKAVEEAKKRAVAIFKGKNTNNISTENKINLSNNDVIEKINHRSSKDNSQTIKTFKEENDELKDNNLSIAQKLRQRINNHEKRTGTKTKTASSKNTQSNMSNYNNKRKYAFDEEESDFSEEESEFSTDDDYVDKKPKKKKFVTGKTKNVSKSFNKSCKSRKLLSSDEDEKKNKNAFNIWIEVYIEDEESWISVDILDKNIQCISEIYKKASQPVLYIIAWNSVGTIKDVTRRYCPHWLTDTRKKRVDEKWWNETLHPWKEKKTAISKAEDEQLLQKELEQPLPKTITQCKGHPLFVLTRHLLKYEALYPPDCVPLGYLKTGEAVYSRHCVHTLMSREKWVKKARVVKLGEQSYKIVKSLPKWDKLSGQILKDQPLELFGRWQTMPYEPPIAKDGKVPRNEYGNVDLFKMCMLPIGTAYINLPGLSRIARKLSIDCAPACVGFAFGKRGALPAFEGFVVCEEYEDTLRLAWEEEQIEAQKRAEEKHEKRIYGNWKKLIKGLLIREKLAAKYNFGDDADNEDREKCIRKKIPMEIEQKKIVKKKELKIAKKSGYVVKILESDFESNKDDEYEQKMSSETKSKTKMNVINQKKTKLNKQKVALAKKDAMTKSEKIDTVKESLEFEKNVIDKGESSRKLRCMRTAALKASIKEVSSDDGSVDGGDDYREEGVVFDDDEYVEKDDKGIKKSTKKITLSKAKMRDVVLKRTKQDIKNTKKKLKR